MYARDITQVGASSLDDHAVKAARSDSAQTLRPRRAKVHHEASAATTARYSNGSINCHETGYTLFPLPSCSISGVRFGSQRTGRTGYGCSGAKRRIDEWKR